MILQTPKPTLLNRLKAILKGLVAALLLLVLFLVIAFSVLRYNPALLSAALEAGASRFLDRELQIGELVEAELNWDTYLLARNVSLANPEWAEAADFITVNRLLIRINLPSIWREGPILITELELTDLKVNLLAPTGQSPNWEFWPGRIIEDLPQPETGEYREPEPVFPVIFRDGRVTRGQVAYRDSRRDVRLTIDTLAIAEAPDVALIGLDLNGAINDIPLSVQGRIGPFAALLTQRDLQLDLAVEWGMLLIEGSGTIADLANLSGPDLHLKVSSPSARPLLDMLGMAAVRDGPLHFDGHITDAQPGVTVEAVGVLGDFDLQFSATLADPMAIDGVEVAFELDGPSLAELGAMFDFAGLPAVPYKVSGEITRTGSVLGLREGFFSAGESHLSLAGRLPAFPEIDDWELEVEGESVTFALLGPMLEAEDLPGITYAIKGRLESTDEGVELLNLTFSNPASRLVLDGVVGEAPDYLGTRIDLKFSGDTLAAVGPWLGIHTLPNLAFQVAGAVSLSAGGWQLSDGMFSTPGLQLALAGEVDKLLEPTSLRARLGLESPDLAAVLKVYGYEVEGLPAFPIVIDSAVSGAPDKLEIERATVISGDSRISVSGLLGDPLTLAGLDLAIEVATPDVFEFLSVVNSEPLPRLPLDVGGQITLSPEGVAFNQVKGTIGGARLSLQGLVSGENPLDDFHFTLSTQGPDLGAVLAPWWERDIAHAPYQLTLKVEGDSGALHVEQLEASVADAHISAQISFDKLEDLTSAHGTIKLDGPSSANLAQLLGIDGTIGDTTYALSVVIEKTPDWLQLNPIRLETGDGDLSGSVNIHLGPQPAIDMDLHSKFVNFSFLLPNLNELESEAQARTGLAEDAPVLSQKLSAKELAERVIPDEPLDFDWLRNVQVSVRYQVDEIFISNEMTSTAIIDFSIADGVLSSKRIHWDGNFLAGDAELVIRALGETNEIDLYLDLERVPLFQFFGGVSDNQPGAMYRARVRAVGNTLRQMARSSNGVLLINAGGGRLDNHGVDLILGDAFDELIVLLNPFAETDTHTRIICYAAALTIEDGKIKAVPGLAVRTDKMDLASAGEINLHNEKLNLAFNSRSRKGVGISASKAITPYFKIGGTLANPRLALDVKGAALSGGAAVATGGLSILAEGLWDRWVATAKNPCERLIMQISKTPKEPYRTLLEPAPRN